MKKKYYVKCTLWHIYIAGFRYGFQFRFELQTKWLHCTTVNGTFQTAQSQIQIPIPTGMESECGSVNVK